MQKLVELPLCARRGSSHMKKMLSFTARRTGARIRATATANQASHTAAAQPAAAAAATLPSNALSATDAVRLLPVTVDRDDAPCVSHRIPLNTFNAGSLLSCRTLTIAFSVIYELRFLLAARCPDLCD